VDGAEALQHALASLSVPGAVPRTTAADAAVGLSYLDTALRAGHVRRLTERLTISDHRVAHRTTQVDLSLGMLDDGQRRALSDAPDGTIWVPVALLPRSTAAPVDIRDATGARVPRLPEQEVGELVAAGLGRLLRGILDTLPRPRATPTSRVCCTAPTRRSGCYGSPCTGCSPSAAPRSPRARAPSPTAWSRGTAPRTGPWPNGCCSSTRTTSGTTSTCWTPPAHTTCWSSPWTAGSTSTS